MISFEKAISICMENAFTLPTEIIKLENSVGRILAKDIFSDIDIPPFDKSAMDGYACRTEDLKNDLQIIEIIKAGDIPKKELKKNQCSKIMTGAPLPKGANTVIIWENIEKISENKIRLQEKFFSKKESNICYKNEDLKKYDLILEKNTRIEIRDIGILASVGCEKLEVYRKVKVGIISTGNEIVEINQKPKISQIRNSNAYQLITQLKAMKVIPEYIGIAKDEEKDTLNKFRKAIENNDLVIFTGGVSAGDFDFVPKILKKEKFKILFDKVAVQPGKPTTFAIKNNLFCFGLPGNPVASYIQFELLVKAFLYKLMSYDYKNQKICLELKEDFKRKKAKRKSFFPVKIKNNKIIKMEYNGSGHVHSISKADGFISLEVGQKEIKKGKLIDVIFL